MRVDGKPELANFANTDNMLNATRYAKWDKSFHPFFKRACNVNACSCGIC